MYKSDIQLRYQVSPKLTPINQMAELVREIFDRRILKEYTGKAHDHFWLLDSTRYLQVTDHYKLTLFDRIEGEQHESLVALDTDGLDFITSLLQAEPDVDMDRTYIVWELPNDVTITLFRIDQDKHRHLILEVQSHSIEIAKIIAKDLGAVLDIVRERRPAVNIYLETNPTGQSTFLFPSEF